ncbi:MAG: hypothetical protein LC749_01815 [Actinobacteria bacterium]|nr:hypothetical protein [Actinomycetota bacterium]
MTKDRLEVRRRDRQVRVLALARSEGVSIRTLATALGLLHSRALGECHRWYRRTEKEWARCLDGELVAVGLEAS